jgi:hypothetical protein
MAKETKRKNKTEEELRAEAKQAALKHYLEDIEEVNVKHSMRLIPILQSDVSTIRSVFSVEDIVKAEYNKVDKKDDKESKTNKSTDSDDKGTKE